MSKTRVRRTKRQQAFMPPAHTPNASKALAAHSAVTPNQGIATAKAIQASNKAVGCMVKNQNPKTRGAALSGPG